METRWRSTLTCVSISSLVAALESDIASGAHRPDGGAARDSRYLGSRYDFTKPMALDDVTADVERMMRQWQVQVTHPRYFGLFNPSVTLASVVADTLVASYNPQLATWRTSPAANEIERHTLAWLARQVRPARDDERELHERRRRGEPLGGDRRVDARVPAVRRRRAAEPVGVAGDLPDARGPRLVQQDRAHDRDRPPGAAHGRDRRAI